MLLQFIERFRQLIGGRFVELNQPHVSNLERSGQIGIEQARAFDALHFDLGAFERVILYFLGRRSNQRQRNFLTGRAAQMIDHILQIHPLGRSAIDF